VPDEKPRRPVMPPGGAIGDCTGLGKKAASFSAKSRLERLIVNRIFSSFNTPAAESG
jgi:hypothetical protein